MRKHFSVLLTTFVLAACSTQSVEKKAAFPGALEAGWAGEPVCEALEALDGIRLSLCIFGPDGGQDAHSHGQYWAVALDDGWLQFETAAGREQRPVPAGDTFFQADVPWHAVKNAGASPIRLLIAEVIGAPRAALSLVPPDGLPPAIEAGWRGDRVCERLHEDNRMRVARCTFPPNVGHEEHYHVPHMGFALAAGVMAVRDADGVREQTIPEGAHWSREGLIRHEAVNVGQTTASYIIIEPKR